MKFSDLVRLSKARIQGLLNDGFERYVGLEHLEPGDLRFRSLGNVADSVTVTCVFQPWQMLFGKRRSYYVPGSRFLAALCVQPAATSEAVTNSHQLDANSHQLSSGSRQLSSGSHQPLAPIPAELTARIREAGSKPRQEVLRSLIVDLCRWRALSGWELAIILHGREHKPLVRDYLSPIVAEGLLAYTIPVMENHPDQCYTVLAESAEEQP